MTLDELINALKEIQCTHGALSVYDVSKERMTAVDTARSFTHKKPEPDTVSPTERPKPAEETCK